MNIGYANQSVITGTPGSRAYSRCSRCDAAARECDREVWLTFFKHLPVADRSRGTPVRMTV
jgi:hypothetical protein